MKITIGKNDSVIIFHDDGEEEAHVPRPPSDDDPICNSAFKVLLCLTFLNDQELVDLVTAKIRPH